MPTRAPLLILLLLALQRPETTVAYSSYRGYVPNGERSPGGCNGWGHTSCSGGGANRGSTVAASPNAWTAACSQDTDGDGWRNGEELGDACCVWSHGGGTSTSRFLSLSSSCSSAVCEVSNPRDVSSTPTFANQPSGFDIRKYRTEPPTDFAFTSATLSGNDVSLVFDRAMHSCYFRILVCSSGPGCTPATDVTSSISGAMPSEAAKGMYLDSSSFSVSCQNCVEYAGLTYTFRVSAHNHNAAATLPSTGDISVSGTAEPASVSISTTATPGVSVSWDAVSGAGGYTVQYSTTAAFSTTVDVAASGSDTSMEISGLMVGQSYYFRVRADTTQLWTMSSPASVQLTAVPASSPSMVSPSAVSPSAAMASPSVSSPSALVVSPSAMSPSAVLHSPSSMSPSTAIPPPPAAVPSTTPLSPSPIQAATATQAISPSNTPTPSTGVQQSLSPLSGSSDAVIPSPGPISASFLNQLGAGSRRGDSAFAMACMVFGVAGTALFV